MAIRKIYFQLDDSRHSVEQRSDFLFETYYITEYISRNIRREKLTYKAANKVLIYLGSDRSDISYSELFKSICIRLTEEYCPPSAHRYTERLEWLMDILWKSAAALDSYIPGASVKVNSILEGFRRGGYKNVWAFHSRTIRNVGKLSLECELNKSDFLLYFVVRNKDDELYRKQILQSKPDSLCYHHLFNKMVVGNGLVVVPDRRGPTPGVLFSVHIDELARLNK